LCAGGGKTGTRRSSVLHSGVETASWRSQSPKRGAAEIKLQKRCYWGKHSGKKFTPKLENSSPKNEGKVGKGAGRAYVVDKEHNESETENEKI